MERESTAHEMEKGGWSEVLYNWQFQIICMSVSQRRKQPCSLRSPPFCECLAEAFFMSLKNKIKWLLDDWEYRVYPLLYCLTQLYLGTY